MTSSKSEGGARRSGPGGGVAIIGMACIFPGTPNLEAYWQNIVRGVDAITDVPAGGWDPELFFDPDSTANDRLYCKRGGYLGDLAHFNPLDYGIMPVVLDAGDPEQFLSLRVAHEALADAGYASRPFNRERTEVILGLGNYGPRGIYSAALHTLGVEEVLQILRTLHPEYTAQELAAIKKELKASLPPFGPDIASSLAPNLTAGRIANRMDLMGTNFTVDAACASALIAADLGMRDLLTGRCDLALVGAIHLANHVPFLATFCQLNALSRQSQIRPFDKDADGTLPGQGVGVVVLKRREDAEQDGDRIYAVIKGVGVASDGRAQGPVAPRVEGEELAIRRAYEVAGVSPDTVELIEAHGTGMPVGDLAEVQALTRVFGMRKGALPTCAIGTIKSMIGHLMPAAGIAGLIKAALAVYHKVLPPTLHYHTPNPTFELETTPFYVNREARPWIHGTQEPPRRAAVSAFGFGGINAHVILEEHPRSFECEGPRSPNHWETEVCLLQGESRQDLIAQLQRLRRYLDAMRQVDLRDLAYRLNTELREASIRVAVVASSIEDLREKLAFAGQRLADPECRQIKDVRGVYFFEEPLRPNGKLVFLFPGEASQYPNMLRDLCLHFPEARAAFDILDHFFIKTGRSTRPSQSIFPIPAPSEAERLEMEKRLWELGGGLGAILTANWALYTLLRRLAIRPDLLLGHSSGEFSALIASGILTGDRHLLERMFALGAIYERLAAEGKIPAAALVAVGADRNFVRSLLEQFGGQVYISMDNCANQVVIVGKEETVEETITGLRAQGVICQRLPFNRAYHTPLFAGVTEPLREFFQSSVISSPEIEVYSSSTMAPYPRDVQKIRDLAVELWSRPVEFRGSVESLYDAGVRIFVEVGPRGNLAAFVGDILRGRPHLAMGCDVPHRTGITQLNHLIGVLAAHGVGMDLNALYESRSPRRLSLEEPIPANDGRPKHSGSRKLALDLPMMGLSPEGARALVPRRVAPIGSGTLAPVDRDALDPGEPGLDPRSVPTSGEPPEPKGSLSAAPDQGKVAHTPTGVISQVMQEHLRTMEQFLKVQQEVMEAFLGDSGVCGAPKTVETPSATIMPCLPFIGTITSLTPGQEVVIRRRMDPDEDVFLRDHSFGGHVSDIVPGLRPLAVMPFTMEMEIAAEAAALLVPDKLLIGMRHVQVRHWVGVESQVTLEINARKQPSGVNVDVEIRRVGDGIEADVPSGPPIVEGTAIFGDAYPQAPPIAPLSLISERPCRHTAKDMYEQRLMFHGPRLRVVASLDRLGENGILGHLQVLPPTDLFRSATAPRLLTHPVLLDGAVQLLGYWAVDHIGYSAYPVSVSALEFYGPNLPESERVRCEVEGREVTSHRLQATVSLFGPDEHLWARLVDLEHSRVSWIDEFSDFFRFPKTRLLSKPWEAPISLFPRREAFTCQRLIPTPENTRVIARNVLSGLILSAMEREQFGSLKGPEMRRTEWLFGRAAAKDAVRLLLKRRHDMDVFAADIEIGHDQGGRPFASALSLGESLAVPSISLSHTSGLVVAVAGYCSQGQRLGIDVEQVSPREEAFQEIAFAGDELRLLDSLAGSAREEWVTRFWCAKEAVGKALGTGLVDGPRSVTVRDVDAPAGIVKVVLGERLAREVPELAGSPLVVYTAREEDRVVASTLCERSYAVERLREDDLG